MKRRCQFLGGPIEGLHTIPDDVMEWKIPVKSDPQFMFDDEGSATLSNLPLFSITIYRRTSPHVFVYESELP